MAEFQKKRVARYIRVSTTEQRTGLQVDETTALIERRGWHLVETYEDHGVSGSRDQRPALARLLADARRGKFDCVVVWRTDRFFRSLRHLVNTLDDLASIGIDFVSATEPIDTTTPSGRLMLHLVAAFGEFERNILIERTRAGMAAARRRGARIGRPRASLNLDEALRLKRSGASIRDIATALGVNRGSVHRALKADAAGPSPKGLAERSSKSA